jgi:hypothetical protein
MLKAGLKINVCGANVKSHAWDLTLAVRGRKLQWNFFRSRCEEENFNGIFSARGARKKTSTEFFPLAARGGKLQRNFFRSRRGEVFISAPSSRGSVADPVMLPERQDAGRGSGRDAMHRVSTGYASFPQVVVIETGGQALSLHAVAISGDMNLFDC